MAIEAVNYEKRFRNHWKRFLERFKITSDLRQNVYTDLHRRYGERHRTYHGVKRQVLLLDELEVARTEMPEWFQSVGQDTAIELALWGIDLFYNSGIGDNKEESAERAIEHAHDLGISAITGAQAGQLILTTKHLQRPEKLPGRIVTDIDLSMLAAPWPDFVQSIRDLREESGGPEEDFRKRLKDILEGMARWDHIYSTQYFRDKYEERAQDNLLRSYRETFSH